MSMGVCVLMYLGGIETDGPRGPIEEGCHRKCGAGRELGETRCPCGRTTGDADDGPQVGRRSGLLCVKSVRPISGKIRQKPKGNIFKVGNFSGSQGMVLELLWKPGLCVFPG